MNAQRVKRFASIYKADKSVVGLLIGCLHVLIECTEFIITSKFLLFGIKIEFTREIRNHTLQWFTLISLLSFSRY